MLKFWSFISSCILWMWCYIFSGFVSNRWALFSVPKLCFLLSSLQMGSWRCLLVLRIETPFSYRIASWIVDVSLFRRESILSKIVVLLMSTFPRNPLLALGCIPMLHPCITRNNLIHNDLATSMVQLYQHGGHFLTFILVWRQLESAKQPNIWAISLYTDDRGSSRCWAKSCCGAGWFP